MSSISPAKANHLFWLGRYAERLFAQLHFLRRYYDLCLDEGREDALQIYCRKLSLVSCPADRETFLYQHLFENTPGSLLYCLECLNDNSIVLREELTTASISYVNLCMATLNHCRHKHDINIVRLQPVTDYILAFWGSVFQHVTNIATLDMLFIGKHVEYIDMYSRFDYPFPRISAEWESLDHRFGHLEDMVNGRCRNRLREIFSDGHDYEKNIPDVLCSLNSLVMV